jgi:hypothetical protein
LPGNLVNFKKERCVRFGVTLAASQAWNCFKPDTEQLGRRLVTSSKVVAGEVRCELHRVSEYVDVYFIAGNALLAHYLLGQYQLSASVEA